MDYYSKVTPMYLLKNYISNDPIIDYFEIQNIHSPNYIKDKNNFFYNYILLHTTKYKNAFFDNIKKKINEIMPDIEVHKYLDENSSAKLIVSDYPVLIKPKLINKKYNIIVSVDLIMKKYLFKKIFYDLENININSIEDNYYIILNIIPQVVSFKADIKTLITNEIIKYNECELYVFNSALKQYNIHRDNIGFICTKGYKYKDKLLDKKKYIGVVKYDGDIKNLVINSLEWLKRLKSNSYRIINEPECIELYPNMNYKNTEYQNEKKKLAKRIKEITLVWKITYNERCSLIKNNIKTWDNPYLLRNLYDFKDTNIRHIQENIIHINTQNDITIMPRILSNYNKSFIEPSKNEYILDIESLLNLEEKTSYFTDIISEDKATICIIGSIHMQNNKMVSFKDYTINNLSLSEEKNIVCNWLNTLKSNDNGFIKIYHWGNAEKVYINYLRNKYLDIIWPKILLLDILEVFKKEPIIIKNCFNFSLKTIGKQMFYHNMIKNSWSETDSGLDASIRFKQICEINKDKKIPLKRYNEISDIINYNKIDCLVLKDIIQYLRNRYLTQTE